MANTCSSHFRRSSLCTGTQKNTAGVRLLQTAPLTAELSKRQGPTKRCEKSILRPSSNEFWLTSWPRRGKERPHWPGILETPPCLSVAPTWIGNNSPLNFQNTQFLFFKFCGSWILSSFEIKWVNLYWDILNDHGRFF